MGRIRRVETLQKKRDGAIAHCSPQAEEATEILSMGVYPKILAKSTKSWTEQVAVIPVSGSFPAPYAHEVSFMGRPRPGPHPISLNCHPHM